jgi:hypothetical protein
MKDENQCNVEGCTEKQVADWGVCVDCYVEKSEEIKKEVFPELYD